MTSHLSSPPQVNVMGAHCDLCKPGFYNLQGSHELGCTDCFCFGVSDVCESSTWSRAQVTCRDSPAPGTNTPLTQVTRQHFMVFLFLFQVFHTSASLRPSQSLHTPPVIYTNDLPISNNASGHAHQQVLSWAAPDRFLGNKVSRHFHIWSLTISQSTAR